MTNPTKSLIYSKETSLIMEFLYEARFVGGCVRDTILKKEICDIDIATPLVPEETIKRLEKAGIKTIPTGIKHGTITAVVSGKSFEITTLRRDISCDGRHAEVKFSDSWEEDASRRDFTFNALSMDTSGKIYDYHNGIDDLENGIVRFVGNPYNRIKEDYLRILRYFRFHALYGSGEILHIKPCRSLSDGLRQLSGERIQSEMLKILSVPNPLYVITEMNKNNVLSKILPEFSFPLDLSSLERIISSYKIANPYIRFAAMLINNNPTNKNVLSITSRWKLSNKDRNYLLELSLDKYSLRKKDDIADWKKILRKTGKELFIDIARVLQSIDTLSFCGLTTESSHKKQGDKYKKMQKLAEEWEIPTFPIRGQDIRNLGIKEGKEIGELMKKVEIEWEHSNYTMSKSKLLDSVVTIYNS